MGNEHTMLNRSVEYGASKKWKKGETIFPLHFFRPWQSIVAITVWNTKSSSLSCIWSGKFLVIISLTQSGGGGGIPFKSDRDASRKFREKYLKATKIHTWNSFMYTLRSCSIGINRFNRNRFRLKRLRFPNRTLFQPSSLMPVEKVDQPNQPKTVFSQ